MPKRTRNTLLIFGIFLSVLLLLLRVEGQLSAVSGDLSMFSEMLGYEETKSYAVLLLDSEKEPLLFLFIVSNGDIEFKSVGSASVVLKNVPKSEFAATADTLIEKILSTLGIDIDIVGFVTSSAAGEMADALGGLTIQNQQISSGNLSSIVWEIAHSKNAEQTLNDSASFPKRNFITHSRSILFAAKNVFSKGVAAIYFKDSDLFGKSCLGACGVQMFDYLNSSGSFNR